MDAAGQRLTAALAAALAAHAVLLAGLWQAPEVPASELLRVTRDAGPAPAVAHDATKANRNQRGDDDRSQTARAATAPGEPRTSEPAHRPAPAHVTRFVFLANTPAPAAPAHEETVPAAANEPMPARAARSRDAERDARATYLAAWQDRIEALGSRRYPSALLADGTRRRLTMAVRLGADGSLRAVRILRSSGSDALDRAALALVQAAAPYPPFDTAIAEHTGALDFVYDWLFEAGDDPTLERAKGNAPFAAAPGGNG